MPENPDETLRGYHSDRSIPPERHRDFPRGDKISSTSYGREVFSGLILGLILGGFIAAITGRVECLLIGDVLLLFV
jgi:hypothetical protein